MKRFLRSIKMMALALMAVAMLSGTSVLKAHAQVILGGMEITEDGRVKIKSNNYSMIAGTDDTGRNWYGLTYPYCTYEEEYTEEKVWGDRYLL